MAAQTTQLQLLTPTQGTLTGTWGDTVNYGITEYVNIAIAGTLSFAGDGAITLANTLGNSSGTNFTSTTAQYAVIRVTGTLTTTKTITGPSYSKIYLVDNAATGGSVAFQRSGQVTPVTITAGTRAFVYYNGTDYVSAAGGLVDLTSGVTGVLPIANGGTNSSTASGARTNLGATTLGANLFTIPNPSAITYPQYNADNTVTALSASAFRTAIGAGTGGGSVSSVGGTGTVNGITLTGTVTSTGNLTLGGTLSGVNLTTQVTGVLPLANGGTNNTSGVAVSAPLLQTTNFSISEVGGVLVFKYGATTIATMDSTGNLTTLNNMTAYGSI
jgi:hypothetical protein